MHRLRTGTISIILVTIAIGMGCSPNVKNVSFSVVNNSNSKIYVQYVEILNQDTSSVEIVTDNLFPLLSVQNSSGGSNWFYDYQIHINTIYNLAGDSIQFNPNESQIWFLYVSDPDYFYRLYIKDTDF